MTPPPIAGRSRDVVAATFVLVGTVFLPWAESGSVSRSGWSIVGSARRLGVVDSTFGEVVAVGFFVLPIFAFAALTMFALDRPRLVAAASGLAVVATVVVAAAVIRSSLGPRWGLWLNVATACVDGFLTVRLWRSSPISRVLEE